MIPFGKSIGVGVAAASFLAVAGFSVAEVGEYLQVARDRVATTVRENIPLSVEIDRMEVLLKKLDAQVQNQKYAVAKSRVALQDAEAELQRSKSVCESLLTEMRELRHLSAAQTTTAGDAVTVGCHKVSCEDVRRALSFKLSSWKTASATAKAREEALEQQQTAFTRLEEQFGDWQAQRSLLAQRLEMLKARHQTQQLSSDTDTKVVHNADLARATELADQIEREVRIAEAQQALGNDSVTALMPSAAEAVGRTEAVESEVDAILRSGF